MPTGPRPPIPPGFAKVVVGGTTLTHQWRWIFYLQLTGTGVTVNDLQSIANQIDSLFNTNIVPLIPNTVTETLVQVTFIPSVGNEITFQGTYNRTGTGAGTQVADASAAYVIQWKISAYYRGGHPRSYMPGVTTTSVTNGSQIAAATASAYATGFNAVRNGLNAFTTTNVSAIVMGTLSFQSAKVWRATPVFRAFTSVAVSGILGSQRRRIHS